MISLVRARWQFHYHLANLFLRLRRYEAAANAYGRALRVRPEDSLLQLQRAWCLLVVPSRRLEGLAVIENQMKSSPSAYGYSLLAWGFQKESRHEEAVQALREVARLDPTQNADFHYDHATCLSALGRLEEAAEAYQTAAHLNPSDGEAWGNLGASYADLGRWKDAAPCQERAMRLAPSVPNGLNLGDTLYELNRLDEAERVLRESLVIDPRSTDVKELLAIVLAGQDRYDDALTLVQELYTVKPVPPSSRVALAVVLMEAGRLEEALQEAISAGQDAPSDPRPQGVLGSIYVKMNDGAAALAAFVRFQSCVDQITKHPSVPWRVGSAVGRGNALSVLGRHEEAMSAFEEALRIDPGFFERWPEMTLHYDRSARETQRSG